MAENVTRVFVPSGLLQLDSCALFGWWSESGKEICVLRYMDLDSVEVNFKSQLGNLTMLGTWDNALQSPDCSAACQQAATKHPRSIRLVRTNSELPEIYIRHNHSGEDTSTDAVVVLFDARDVEESSFLEMTSEHSNLGLLYHKWRVSSNDQVTVAGAEKVDSSLAALRRFVAQDCGISNHLWNGFMSVILSLYYMMSAIVLSISESRICCSSWFSYLRRPAALRHLTKRAHHIRTVRFSNIEHLKLRKFRQENMVYKFLFDLLLGLSVMYVLLSDNTASTVSNHFIVWAQSVASELQRLLKWMMGVPAGLKLNQQLAHFLGQFFLYHIYLWTGYLQLLEPLWKHAVWLVAVCGCLGVSFQLSLIQDVLSLMTLHSYCFYVYAARLYHLQTYGLVSLWRLFRGKKWNPLFQRVDSSSYDVDQLFIGTLLFTILLFLLPTTGLFYVVFTTLRLVVLVLQGVLYRCVGALNTTPLYIVFCRLFTPRAVAGKVRLHVLPSLPNRPLYHAIQLLPLPLTELMESVDGPTLPADTKDDYSWGALLNKLITGHLVYPWIEPATKDKND